MHIRTTLLLLLTVLVLSSAELTADMITISRLDTDDIVIPVFDPSLGTLDRVDVSLTLRRGRTDRLGEHTHSSYSLLSTNTRGNTFVSSFSPFDAPREIPSSLIVSAETPIYAQDGLDLGALSFDLTIPGHNHLVTISDAGRIATGPNQFRQRVDLEISTSRVTSGTYDGSKNLSYTGSELTLFLGSSDIVIAAGSFATDPIPAHTHSVKGFSVTVNSSSGPWTWEFDDFNLPLGGELTPTLDPRFDTEVTFHYTTISAVPEPSSLMLFGFGGLCTALVFVRQKRRERKAE